MFVQIKLPAIMGIINCSANSFHGSVATVNDAVLLASKMVDAGVSILDLGGVATNPSVDLSIDKPTEQQELDLVLPVLEALQARFDVVFSVDTSTASVMSAVINQGVGIINDQQALRTKAARSVIASHSNVSVCIMHHFMQARQPGEESFSIMFNNIINDMKSFIEQCEIEGINRKQLIIDPGFGQGHFSKNTPENFYLLSQLSRFKTELFDLPVLVGWSRKSMIGDVVNKPSEERLAGSVAIATIAALLGADILRVHDVEETRQALAVAAAYKSYSSHQSINKECVSQ